MGRTAREDKCVDEVLFPQTKGHLEALDTGRSHSIT